SKCKRLYRLGRLPYCNNPNWKLPSQVHRGQPANTGTSTACIHSQLSSSAIAPTPILQLPSSRLLLPLSGDDAIDPQDERAFRASSTFRQPWNRQMQDSCKPGED